MEQELQAANFLVPFTKMKRSRHVDILCPFGDRKLVLINGLSEGGWEEDDDKQKVPIQVHNSELVNISTSSSSVLEAAQANIH